MKKNVHNKTKVSALDVAAYILKKKGQMTTWKLQKLVYYCQAWSLVWDDKPLFYEQIEAWANGPVVKELFEAHRGKFEILRVPGGKSTKLNATQRETVDSVLNYYGNKSSQWLSDLTHMEDPWRNAREGLPNGSPSAREISLDKIAEYYLGL